MNNVILLGTTSVEKLKIVRDIHQGQNVNILPIAVSSDIDDQPLSEKITIIGAVNRAMNAFHGNSGMYSIGLEAGLEKIGCIYHMVCVACLIDLKNRQYIGISKKIPLPLAVSHQIEKGEEYGLVIRNFHMREKGNLNENVLEQIEELISRKQSFKQALEIALMQYQNNSLF